MMMMMVVVMERHTLMHRAALIRKFRAPLLHASPAHRNSARAPCAVLAQPSQSLTPWEWSGGRAPSRRNIAFSLCVKTIKTPKERPLLRFPRPGFTHRTRRCRKTRRSSLRTSPTWRSGGPNIPACLRREPWWKVSSRASVCGRGVNPVTMATGTEGSAGGHHLRPGKLPPLGRRHAPGNYYCQTHRLPHYICNLFTVSVFLRLLSIYLTHSSLYLCDIYLQHVCLCHLSIYCLRLFTHTHI